MGKYVVITDAAADIPYELFEKGFGVTVIPIKIEKYLMGKQEPIQGGYMLVIGI